MSIEIDVRNLAKWLNEEQLSPIDKQALARVLAHVQMAEQPARQQEPWVGLTDDDDIIGMARDSFAVRYCALPVPECRIKTFASAIEAKLKEKNNG